MLLGVKEYAGNLLALSVVRYAGVYEKVQSVMLMMQKHFAHRS